MEQRLVYAQPFSALSLLLRFTYRKRGLSGYHGNTAKQTMAGTATSASNIAHDVALPEC